MSWMKRKLLLCGEGSKSQEALVSEVKATKTNGATLIDHADWTSHFEQLAITRWTD